MATRTVVQRLGVALLGLGLAVMAFGYATTRIPTASRMEFIPSKDPQVIQKHNDQRTQCLVANISGMQTPPWCDYLPMYAGETRQRPMGLVVRDTIGNYLDPILDQGYKTGALAIWWGARILVLGLFLWLLYDMTLAKLFRWIRHGNAQASG